MLDPKKAAEALKQFEIADWKQRSFAKLKKLPETSFKAGCEFLNLSETGGERDHRIGRPNRDSSDELQIEGAKELASALFPKLASTIHFAIDDCSKQLYSVGFTRPIRWPGDLEKSREMSVDIVRSAIQALENYDPDIVWLAAYAAHLGRSWGSDIIARLLAAEIDRGGKDGDAVFDILAATVRGEHEIGAYGRSVFNALMMCSRPEAWEIMEKLLLAAQRDEGLRKFIIEGVRDAHPQLFRRMLKLIQDENLARFSSVIQSAMGWFHLNLRWETYKQASDDLARLLLFLDDADARTKALTGGSLNEAYLALWSVGYTNGAAAVELAAGILKKDKSADRRCMAAKFLSEVHHWRAREAVIDALDDEDLRLPAYILHSGYEKMDFDRIETLMPRFPDKITRLKHFFGASNVLDVSKATVADALAKALGDLSAARLVPHVRYMSSWPRNQFVRDLKIKEREWSPDLRALLFELVGDAQCSESALGRLQNCRIAESEAQGVEELLERKSEGIRRAALSLLAAQTNSAALASAERMLASKKGMVRLGGLDLLRTLFDSDRDAAACRSCAEKYKATAAKITPEEEKYLAVLLRDGADIGGQTSDDYTFDNAMGLCDLSQRTKAPPMQQLIRDLVTPAAMKAIKSLDDLFHKHCDTPVKVQRWKYNREDDGEFELEAPREELLCNISEWEFGPHPRVPLERDIERLPLREVWTEWWSGRPAAMRDKDGLDLLRIYLALSDDAEDDIELKRYGRKSLETVLKLQHKEHVRELIEWLMRLFPPSEKGADFALDFAESTLARIPHDAILKPMDKDDYYTEVNEAFFCIDWRRYGYTHSLSTAESLKGQLKPWTGAHDVRNWNLHKWVDEPVAPDGRPLAELAPKKHANLRIARDTADLLPLILKAHKCGAANEADIYDCLMHSSGRQSTLNILTKRKPDEQILEYPVLRPIVDAFVRRTLEIELARGEAPTGATQYALAIASLCGADTMLRVVQALGKSDLRRLNMWNSDYNKSTVFSHLIRVTYPAEHDTVDSVAQKIRASGIPAERWAEVALFAPHWSQHIEHALGWSGLEDGVWWIHAHTKGNDWSVDEEMRTSWVAQIAERTPLQSTDLVDGAVDVALFHKCYEQLTKKRWEMLYDAAKFACTGTGHTRAKLFSDAMLGRVKKKELIARINPKRHQDSLRALGLLPLDAKTREKDVLERYQFIQEFIRQSRQFGSMRQTSEKRAARIALENLARTAGYADPIRLEWAMEARAVEDLKDGCISVKAGDITVSLLVDAFGETELKIEKAGKVLKNLPDALKKNEDIQELRERKTLIKRQLSRMKKSLEELMNRGEKFTAAELLQFMRHPLLAPMIKNLVLIGEGISGYPTNGGKTLENYAGKHEPVKKNETLRIAHAFDLFKSKQWHQWQRDCLRRERIQPFKQVFRELYPLTDAERKDATLSRRYAGHQVNPRQALALLTSRGWINKPDEGVRKTFHELGIVASIGILFDIGTPSEIEGVTVETVEFFKRGDWHPLELSKLPPIVFSETMRDMDLVVSVAHRGGLDPEASASSIEMRTALLNETLQVLKIGNVKLKSSHAVVNGKLGDYSVHLGSGVVHLMPGGSLCIIPVHAAHRGRLFLPFADNDPKTAEVMSKVLMLARDEELKDPDILSQIRRKL